jgi:predicted ATPase with chaperone activity
MLPVMDSPSTTAATIEVPKSVEETGVRRHVLEELAIKILYTSVELTLRELATRMRISLSVVQELFQSLRKGVLVEIKGLTEGTYLITTTSEGKTRALELLSQNHYIGPAPISLPDYVKRVRSQSVRNFAVRPGDLEQAFAHLVLGPQMITQLGTALVSGTSIVLYGSTGTGKSSVAEAIPEVYHDRVWVPHAVEIDSQIITIYDPIVHRPVEQQPSWDETDGRWILCRRPRVIVGGELTIDMMDLQFNPVSRFYVAPVQMKANNGVLIIDDFGRQRMRPEELLNRWTVPLDRGVDFLTLVGGRKIDVPFDLFVVFATNLDPKSLADEAFLRRIHNKIRVDFMDQQQFKEVFRRLCSQYGLEYEPVVVDQLVIMLQKELKQPLRACYPLDIISQIRWAAQYQGVKPHLDRETIAAACRNYFLAPS